MCGIVAAIGLDNVVPMLLHGLRRLEYRGYDSAGIALAGVHMRSFRSIGRVAELERQVRNAAAKSGIGHTRWATHGRVLLKNAHPQRSSSGGFEISVVHNGIVENYEALREHLVLAGYVFESDTDTEVIAHLVHQQVAHGLPLFESVQSVSVQLRGAFAVAVVSASEPGVIVGASCGSPLLLGIEGNKQSPRATFLASDPSALSSYADFLHFMKDGEVAELRSDLIRIVNDRRDVVEPNLVEASLCADHDGYGIFQNFTQKEIFDQPNAVARTIEHLIDGGKVSLTAFGCDNQKELLHINRIVILACGSSYYAGCVAKHWLEDIAGYVTTVEIASEYRYRATISLEKTLIVCISQSGETSDTLGAFEVANSLGVNTTLSICNVKQSTLYRKSDLKFLTRAGPEIGVASTKGFTSQLVALLALAVALGSSKGRLSSEHESHLLEEIQRLPDWINNALRCEAQIYEWAQCVSSRNCAMFLGRGIHLPIAFEGALKLKELSYIRAEAYPAGELKHGPLALVSDGVPVISLAPSGHLLSKMKSNLQEVHARGGEIFVISDTGAQFSEFDNIHTLNLQRSSDAVSPFSHVIPLQFLACHAAQILEKDVDKPRNLAKSVTVE